MNYIASISCEKIDDAFPFVNVCLFFEDVILADALTNSEFEILNSPSIHQQFGLCRAFIASHLCFAFRCVSMAPKQSKHSKPSSGYTPASSSHQPIDVETLNDEKIAELLQEMEHLTLEDITVVEGKVSEDVASLKKQLKSKTAQLKQFSEKKTALEAPLKAERRKQREKQKRQSAIEAGKAMRDEEIEVVVLIKGISIQVRVKQGCSTGALREAVYQKLGLPKKLKLNKMMWKDVDIYSSYDENGKPLKGLKRLHKIGVQAEDCVRFIFEDNIELVGDDKEQDDDPNEQDDDPEEQDDDDAEEGEEEEAKTDDETVDA